MDLSHNVHSVYFLEWPLILTGRGGHSRAKKSFFFKGHNQLSIEWIPGVKWPGQEPNRCTSPRVKVKNAWNLTSMAACLIKHRIFIFYLNYVFLWFFQNATMVWTYWHLFIEDILTNAVFFVVERRMSLCCVLLFVTDYTHIWRM